jgi:hypothetical protein
MSGKAIRGALVATAIALAFVLGLWTRPSSRVDRDVRGSADVAAAPSRIGVSRVAAPVARGDEGRAANPDVPHEDVLAAVALGRELKDLYPAEARDEAWAPRVEEFYASEIAKFLALVLPEAEDVEIECKSSTCKLSFVVPADRVEVAYYREQAMPLGDVWQPFDEPLDGGRARVGMYVGIGAERRPIDALTARYSKDYEARFAMPAEQLVRYFERDEARMREEKAR